MINMKEISGFDFYESLRYILPGYFLLFLTAPLLIPEYWTNLDITEKIIYGFILGFFVHSFGIYKWVPGVSNIKKEHLMKHERLTGKKPNQTLLDVMSFTFAEEKYLFKRYYGLGALKLDIVAILIFTVILKIYTIIIKWIEIQQSFTSLMYNFLFILALIIIGYVVREDGMNDIKRAFNLELFVVARSLKGEMKEILTIENENKGIFFRDERKTITDIGRWIYKKIRLKGEHK
jgi:hypothetical protein